MCFRCLMFSLSGPCELLFCFVLLYLGPPPVPSWSRAFVIATLITPLLKSVISRMEKMNIVSGTWPKSCKTF